VIVQTWENHRKIESLLAAMRRPIDASGSTGADEAPRDARGRQWTPDVPDAAEQALRTVLPEVNIQDAPLDAAVRTLAGLARANLVVDGKSMMEAELERKHLQDAGVEVSRTRTIRLYDVTLRQALEAVLREYSDSVWAAGYDVDDGTIVVSSKGAGFRQITRVYELPGWPRAAAAGRRRQDDEVGASSTGEIPEEVELILAGVAPDSWSANGGTGHIRVVAGRLVVTQSWQNHQEVRRVLATLRPGPSASRAAPATAPAPPRGE
jgi:hypothetical protein